MAFWVFFTVLALWLGFVDIRQGCIPNRVLVLLIVAVEIHLLASSTTQGVAHRNLAALATFICGVGLNLALQGAIGMGDIKLFSALTLLLGGLQTALSALLYAALIGLGAALLFRKKSIPFAPALLLGFALAQLR